MKTKLNEVYRKKQAQLASFSRKNITLMGPPIYLFDSSNSYTQAMGTDADALDELLNGKVPEIFTHTDELKKELAMEIRKVGLMKHKKPNIIHDLSQIASMYVASTDEFKEWHAENDSSGSAFLVVVL